MEDKGALSGMLKSNKVNEQDHRKNSISQRFDRCQAYRNIDDEDTLVMIQKWESGEVMERYIRSLRFRPVMDLMELSCEQPEVSFDIVSETMGMRYLDAVRG